MYDLISTLQKIKTSFPKTTLIKNCYHMKMNANVTQTIIFDPMIYTSSKPKSVNVPSLPRVSPYVPKSWQRYKPTLR